MSPFPTALFIFRVYQIPKINALESEEEFSGKLNLPGSALEEKRLAGAGDGSGSCVSNLQAGTGGVVELWCVEDVEGFGAELEVTRAGVVEAKVLEEGDVELLGARTVEDVSPGVAEGVVARTDEVSWIEPLLDG